ncbi:diaminopimelate epimerase [Rossellomorea sp. FS2]|uniref:diaminopimelate epimerase n=1 Tax=Rossellomorea TaxID=2837508 RepID=UPI00064FBB8D|nr:diaminopimelate epimerase [Rossellomorea marisflavi]KML33941.1 diaminopimelate epimerase [Rossellomorea marisflavi]
MKIDVTKCHGSGNDFLLLDEVGKGYDFTDEDRRALTLTLCNRETGPGADGILFVLDSDRCDAMMRVFNSDGSEASMCGNGLRCVGRYVCEKIGKDDIMVETMKADLHVSKEEEVYVGIPTYNVEISPVLFDLSSLPMSGNGEKLIDEKVEGLQSDRRFTALAVPNPHLIAVVDRDVLSGNEQKDISDYLNGPNPLCPDGVNVSYVTIIEEGAIFVRTYERGVGFTNACGTAMSASTLVTCLLGYNAKGEAVDVYNPGGKVRVVVNEHADGTYSMELIGNATYMYEATIQWDRAFPDRYDLEAKKELEENVAYRQLEEHAASLVKEKVFL